MSTRFFWGKNAPIKNFYLIFLDFQRKTFQSSVKFFPASAKMQSRPPAEPLEENLKFEIIFDSLSHKFLAWVSFLLSTCPGETFEEEMASINFFSPTFFSSRKLFRFLGKFFSARLPNMQSSWLEKFSHEMFFLRKLIVSKNIFRKRAEGFWIFVQFFGSVDKNAFLVCGGTYRWKTFIPERKFNFVFGFWSTKIWFWETIRYVRKNCPYLVKRTFGATFFENVISGIIVIRSWAK